MFADPDSICPSELHNKGYIAVPALKRVLTYCGDKDTLIASPIPASLVMLWDTAKAPT